MKFKPPSTESLSVGLTSGHSLLIEYNDGKGSEVPSRFRKAAIAAGCTPVGVGAEEEEQVDPEGERTKHINATLEKLLESDEEGAFDKSGKPNLAKLNEKLGFKLSASERDAAWAAFEATLQGNTEQDSHKAD